MAVCGTALLSTSWKSATGGVDRHGTRDAEPPRSAVRTCTSATRGRAVDTALAPPHIRCRQRDCPERGPRLSDSGPAAPPVPLGGDRVLQRCTQARHDRPAVPAWPPALGQPQQRLAHGLTPGGPAHLLRMGDQIPDRRGLRFVETRVVGFGHRSPGVAKNDNTQRPLSESWGTALGRGGSACPPTHKDQIFGGCLS